MSDPVIYQGLLLHNGHAGEVGQVISGQPSERFIVDDQLQRDIHNYGVAYELITPIGVVRLDPAHIRVHQPGTRWRPRPDQVRPREFLPRRYAEPPVPHDGPTDFPLAKPDDRSLRDRIGDVQNG